jgi:hypothetical protein
MNKIRAIVEALVRHTHALLHKHAHIYIHRDGTPKTTFSHSGELRTCKFIRISRSNFFTIMILSHTYCVFEKVKKFGSSHDFGPYVLVM